MDPGRLHRQRRAARDAGPGQRRPTHDQISNAHYRFGAWCAMFANVPGIGTLAQSIDTWWPQIEAFLRLTVTNARTEGSNPINESAAASQPVQLRAPYPRPRDRTRRGVTGQIGSATHLDPIEPFSSGPTGLCGISSGLDAT